MKLRCPHCNEILINADKTIYCKNNHSFDKAKSGYANLFITNSKNHGDNDSMAIARRDFLNLGHYDHLKNEVINFIKKYEPKNLLDFACGEGYYTKDFPVEDKLGIDLSKKAITYASKLDKNTQYIIASIFKAPLFDESVDCITTIFAPVAHEEIRRLLTDNGVFILVTPGVDHLYELKEAVYDEPYKNEVEPFNFPGLEIIDHKNITGKFTLKTNKEINDLFTMTPYYIRTSRKDMEKLTKIDTLTITYDFHIHVFKKN